MTKLLLADDSSFYPALRTFSLKYPVMGTCAGLIIMARPCGDERVVSLDVLPVSVERNSYGRQTESFIEPVPLSLDGDGDEPPFKATWRSGDGPLWAPARPHLPPGTHARGHADPRVFPENLTRRFSAGRRFR